MLKPQAKPNISATTIRRHLITYTYFLANTKIFFGEIKPDMYFVNYYQWHDPAIHDSVFAMV